MLVFLLVADQRRPRTPASYWAWAPTVEAGTVLLGLTQW